MCLWCTSLLAQHEPRTNPHSTGAVHQCRSDRLAVEYAARSHDLDLLSREWTFLALDHLDHGGDQNGSGDIARMTTAFAALRANQVGANVEALLHMLRVSDHVHVEDAGLVEPLDNGLGRDTDGGNEEFGTAVDDDADQLVQFALGIVVAGTLQRS